MNFVDALSNVIDCETNYSVTENGALGYKTSGKALVDLNFAVTSLRTAQKDTILKMFTKAYSENPMLACRWLFFARDIRGGLGERRLFRIILSDLCKTLPDVKAKQLIELIPEYGRFDDLWIFLDDEKMRRHVIDFVESRLTTDLTNYKLGQPVSLLAKWMPSINTSSKETRRLANILMSELKLTPRLYRKMLAKLRRHTKIVEQQMSAGEWDKIDYSAVPSRANLIYQNAFLKHDSARRLEFLSDVKQGVQNIHSDTLFPHEIVYKYFNHNDTCSYNETLEQLWSHLPDTVKGNSNTIVVADGSGSMYWDLSNGVRPIDVSIALSIYFAERASGQFKDKFITFSANPQLIDLSHCETLLDKIQYVARHNEVANTNIEKVFHLILQTAIANNMRQEDLPQNILIISDMEFDDGVYLGESLRWDYCMDDINGCRHSERLFDGIQQQFSQAGYKLPKLIFWNVCSRTKTIPLKENDLGVALLSGFSINIMNMVMSSELDPYKILVETLMSQRYDAVEKALTAIGVY